MTADSMKPVSMGEWWAASLLAGYLGYVVFRQLPYLFPARFGRTWLARASLLQFAPSWAMFAHGMTGVDYHLLCRHQRADGQLSPWRDALCPKPRRLRDLLWNPGHDLECTLVKMVRALGAEVQALKGGHTEVSPLDPSRWLLRVGPAIHTAPTYLKLLEVADGQARCAGGAAAQFAIVKTHTVASAGPVLVFRSALHSC